MATFTDVPAGTKFYAEIEWAAGQTLLRGWPDRTFRPLNRINRDAMAAALYRLAGEPHFVAPAVSSFPDVVPGQQFYQEIHWVADRGLLRGWTDGTYRPVRPIARDATAAMFYRAAGSPPYMPPRLSRFKDVQPGRQFSKEIHWLASTGITTGWADGTYRPGLPIARDAMAAFLKRFDQAV
jgi:hypothetical protein